MIFLCAPSDTLYVATFRRAGAATSAMLHALSPPRLRVTRRASLRTRVAILSQPATILPPRGLRAMMFRACLLLAVVFLFYAAAARHALLRCDDTRLPLPCLRFFAAAAMPPAATPPPCGYAADAAACFSDTI